MRRPWRKPRPRRPPAGRSEFRWSRLAPCRPDAAPIHRADCFHAATNDCRRARAAPDSSRGPGSAASGTRHARGFEKSATCGRGRHSATGNLPSEVNEFEVRPVRKTYVRVTVDGGAGRAIERWVDASEGLQFKGRRIAVKVLDPRDVEIRKNGKLVGARRRGREVGVGGGKFTPPCSGGLRPPSARRRFSRRSETAATGEPGESRHDQPRLRQKSRRCRNHARQRAPAWDGDHGAIPRTPMSSW